MTDKGKYAIQVVWETGEAEYLKEGSSVATYPTKKEAKIMADFLRMGVEAQSIHVVAYYRQP